MGGPGLARQQCHTQLGGNTLGVLEQVGSHPLQNLTWQSASACLHEG